MNKTPHLQIYTKYIFCMSIKCLCTWKNSVRTWGAFIYSNCELTRTNVNRTHSGKLGRWIWHREKDEKKIKKKNNNRQSQNGPRFTYFNLHKYLAFQCSILITNKIENVEHWLSHKHTGLSTREKGIEANARKREKEKKITNKQRWEELN